MIKIKFILIFLFFYLFSFLGVRAQDSQNFRLRINNLFWKGVATDTEAEIEFGRNVAAKMLGKYELYKNEAATDYVSKIGVGITSVVGRTEIQYYFGVLDTDDINAFATTGGYIFITRGALKKMNNEAELVAVLAHEISHDIKRHVIERLKLKSKDRSVTAGVAKILGAGSLAAQIALERLNGFAFKLLIEEGLSKENEYEADSKAIEIMITLNYPPKYYIDYLKKIQPVVESNNSILSKTHPSIINRINNIDEFIKNNNIEASEGEININRFRGFFENF